MAVDMSLIPARVESKAMTTVLSLKEALAEAIPGIFSTDAFTVFSQPVQVMPSTASVMVLLTSTFEGLTAALSEGCLGAVLQASRAKESNTMTIAFLIIFNLFIMDFKVKMISAGMIKIKRIIAEKGRVGEGRELLTWIGTWNLEFGIYLKDIISCLS